MKIEIKHWYDGRILFKGEFGSLKLAVEAAVSSGASLDEASLDGASLDGASLVGARLDGARLVGASLDGASLDGASLDEASLDGASLDGASLDGARLVGARLVGASLDGKHLAMFRDDIWAVLCSAPNEVDFLLKSLKEGKVDGSQYEGECACLVGTIAKARDCKYDTMPKLQPNSSRPSEQWFTQIKSGDTPANNKAAKMAYDWIREWKENMMMAFGKAAEAEER
ncbi:MAG: pentapeptide repeat-containing protein [Patescibacteria group bacterium]|nr:pentapeptide repeat-containing protein [Patescibacteria group bacterium]